MSSGDQDIGDNIPLCNVLFCSELGIFGYVIGDKDRIITNKQVIMTHFIVAFYTVISRQVGHMLRTKLSHVDEGGVAAGLGALDSVYLIEAKGCCKTPCK